MATVEKNCVTLDSMVRRHGDDPCYECDGCACARFLTIDELLLPSLPALARFIRSLHATRKT
jgi:hypothetical protein